MTEREKIELLREGYARALRMSGVLSPRATELAKVVYPTPTRPREIEVGDGARYRVVDGRVELKTRYGPWRPSSYTLENLRAFGELAANPTEDDV